MSIHNSVDLEKQSSNNSERGTNNDTTTDNEKPETPAIFPETPLQPPAYSAFPGHRRRLALAIVTIAGFLGPVSGNIYIPLLPLLSEVFKVSETTINATVSVFMAVFAVAPLFWASFSDIGGRKTLYLASLLFYIVANILLAAVPANIGALFVLRIVQAFGASSVMSVGAGTVADLVEPKHRAKAISYFMLGPQLGPVLGPVLSVISVNDRWRWIFGFLALLGATIYLIIMFFLPETLRCLVGDGSKYLELNPNFLVKPRLFQRRLITGEESKRYPSPPKPSLENFYHILKYKPVTLCSINAGLLFASFYGVSVTFAQILKDDYKFSHLAISFSYVCPGLSLISGSIIGGRISDRLRARMVAVHPEKYVPEHRFSLQVVGLLISMAGVLGYGWCVDKHVHVVAVFVFTFLTGFGMTFVFVTTTTYLTECSTRQPATNVAIGNFFRNVAAAISSVIIDRMVKLEGFGWCFTGLALIDLFGIAIVLVLMQYGPQWRKEFQSKLPPTPQGLVPRPLSQVQPQVQPEISPLQAK